MKSIAFVESNFTGIDAIRSAARAGYKCYLITSDYKHLKSMLPHDIFEGFDECVEVVRVSDSNDFMVLTQAVSGLGTPISAIVTFSQFRTLVVAKVAKHLGLRGTNPEAISIALDKLAVREKMKQQKLPSISFSSLSNISRNPVPLPCILKPSRGHSSLGIRLIQNNTDLQTAKKNYEETGEDILVEEFLEGPLYSLETVTRSLGKHIAWGYSDRILTEDFIEIGATFPAIAPDYQAGCDLVFSTLDAIGFDFGACHTELIFTKCGPRIVEINPRAGGSGICRLIERAANRDILLDLLKLYLGISS
ncbi:MAG: ATP-grasp domain-containing protein, partial [Bdellovibrionales bacterium]|nr:ATP-grasp domain-containing protein [Bdellovibrionales bacterium]